MKRILVFVIIGLFLSMSYVSIGYAWHGGYAAGALAGGLLLGTVIGSALSQPQVALAPVYAYPSGPPGEWVVVPGQWVAGTWVPAHRTWIPRPPGFSLLISLPLKGRPGSPTGLPSFLRPSSLTGESKAQ